MRVGVGARDGAQADTLECQRIGPTPGSPRKLFLPRTPVPRAVPERLPATCEECTRHRSLDKGRRLTPLPYSVTGHSDPVGKGRTPIWPRRRNRSTLLAAVILVP